MVLNAVVPTPATPAPRKVRAWPGIVALLAATPILATLLWFTDDCITTLWLLGASGFATIGATTRAARRTRGAYRVAWIAVGIAIWVWFVPLGGGRSIGARIDFVLRRTELTARLHAVSEPPKRSENVIVWHSSSGVRHVVVVDRWGLRGRFVGFLHSASGEVESVPDDVDLGYERVAPDWFVAVGRVR